MYHHKPHFTASLLLLGAGLLLFSPVRLEHLLPGRAVVMDTLTVEILPDFETLKFVDLDDSGDVGPGEPFFVTGSVLDVETGLTPTDARYLCRGWFIAVQEDGDVTYVTQSFEFEGRGSIQVVGNEGGGVLGRSDFSRVIAGGAGEFAGISGEAPIVPLSTGGFRITFIFEPVTTVGTRVERPREVPRTFDLGPNYPNPFNPSTQITYELHAPVFMTLRIFNESGQVVRTLRHEQMPPGTYTATWDGHNDAGRPVASGTYLYRLETNDGAVSRKMVLVR